MSQQLPLSVFIISLNEADRIRQAIDSVRDWVDEIHVVDSGSEDDTLEIAGALGAQTCFNEWQGYGAQKQYGESLCANRWILNIDADEIVSKDLRREIETLFSAGEPDCSAYRLPVQPVYPFQANGHPWTITNHPVRLYRKDRAGFRDSTVHDSVVVRSGPTGKLSGPLIHHSFRSLSDQLKKIDRYSGMQAEHLAASGRKPGLLSLMFIPPLAFLKSYLLRREFVNGIDGVVVAWMYATGRFMRLARTRELIQTRTHDSAASSE